MVGFCFGFGRADQEHTFLSYRATDLAETCLRAKVALFYFTAPMLYAQYDPERSFVICRYQNIVTPPSVPLCSRRILLCKVEFRGHQRR